MSSKPSWKWLSPRFTTRYIRSSTHSVQGTRPCVAAMEPLNDRVMLSVSTDSIIVKYPEGITGNTAVLSTLLQGGVKITQDQFEIVKVLSSSDPVPIPYPNGSSKVADSDLHFVKVLDKASPLMLQLEDAIFDLGQVLIKGELLQQKIPAVKQKIDFLTVEIKEAIVSYLTADDQLKVLHLFDTLDADVDALVDVLVKIPDAGSKVDQATYLSLAGDYWKANSLLLRGDIEFAKGNAPGLTTDDFKSKIDALLSADLDTVVKLSDPIAVKFLLTQTNNFKSTADNLLGSLSGGGDGGGDFDGGITIESIADDVIT